MACPLVWAAINSALHLSTSLNEDKLTSDRNFASELWTSEVSFTIFVINDVSSAVA